MTLLSLIVLLGFINSFLGLFTKSTNVLNCGIIGFSGKAGSKFDLQKLKMLFYVNAIERGKDSVGYYTPKNGIKKVAEEFKDLFKDGKKDNIIDTIENDSALIGHVRAKTVGLNTQENAHPWEFDNIIGLHNGTLRGHTYGDDPIATKYGLTYNSYNVDSQYLLHAMSHNFNNIETDLVKALEEYEGAAALLMYHKERETIFACHDKERPLWYGFIGTGMYISSIAGPLHIIGCKNVQEFPVNTLFEIKNGIIINEVPYTPQARVEKKITSNSLLPILRNVKAVAGRYLNSIYVKDPETDHLVKTSTIEGSTADYANITGLIALNDFDLTKLIGYNLRLKGANYSKNIKGYGGDNNHWMTFDDLVPDDVITVLGVDNTYPLSPRVKGRCYRTKQTYTFDRDCLDIEYFLPTRGMYVRCMSQLTFTNEDKTDEIAVWEDEILQVVGVNITTGNVIVVPIYDPLHYAGVAGKLVVSWKYCIPATKDEIRIHTLAYDDNTYQKLFVPPKVETDNNTSQELAIILNDPKDISQEYPSCGCDEESNTEEERDFIEVDSEALDDLLLNVEGSIDEVLDKYKELPGITILSPDEVITDLEGIKTTIEKFDVRKLF